MEDKKWHVLQVKIGTEKKVGRSLEKANFEICVPTEKEVRIWSDRKKRIEVAIFRGYVFIHLSEKQRHLIYVDKNIKGYVKICEKVCTLQAKEMELIKGLGLLGEKVLIKYEKVEKGALIEILGGVLLGYKGFVREANNSRKIRIEIASLNCFAEVVLEGIPIKVLV